MSTLRRTVAGIGAVLLSAGAAFAHAHLASAVPAPEAVVSVAPQVLELRFTESIEAELTELTITCGGQPVPHQAIIADPADTTAISVGFESPLPPGECSISWQTVASDGHKSSDSYSFTIAP